MEKGENN